MQTIEAIRQRVSVREYEPKPIAKTLLRGLVDAGRRAPTAMGEEPWEFVVVTRAEVIEEIGAAVTPCDFVKKAAAVIAVYCRETKYWLEDGCAATENILLAARDFGLGSCWIAGESEPWGAGVSKILTPARGYKLVSLISLGWPRKIEAQVKKRSLAGVLHWEKFRKVKGA